VPFENIHDLEAISGITEKNDIVPIGETADIRAKFGAATPNRAFKRRQLMTVVRSFRTKDSPVATLPLASAI
jgi:hypothetical protein